MTAYEYKSFKKIHKESLRDNMTDIEVILADLGETVTRELVKKHHPYGLNENKKIAKMGGETSKKTRDDIEQKLGESVISDQNKINYKYLNNK